MRPVALHHALDGPADAPPVLFGGSLGTTVAMWEPQVRALDHAYRLIRFDHRGHGGSPVPAGPYTVAELGADVLALMDRLGLARAAYCGLSLGGMVGQWLAINAPQRIDRLILISTAAQLPPASGWHERAAAVRAAGDVGAIADSVLGRWFTPGYAAGHPEVVARHRAMVAGTPPEGYAACCEAVATMDERAGLPRITAPTLVIMGAQDPATPPGQGERIVAAVPDARLEILDPGAHLTSVERADEVSALIAAHLDLGGSATQ